MVEIPRAVGELNDIALIACLEAQVAVEVEYWMRVLEADLYVFGVFVGFEEVCDLVVVVGVVEDVGRREAQGITDLLQPLHKDLEKARIVGLCLVKLLVEGFFPLRRGAANEDDHSNYFNPSVPFLCRINSSPRS